MEQIIPNSVIINMAAVAICGGFLPIVIAFFLIVFKKINLKPFVYGAMAFVASQILRNIFLNIIAGAAWYDTAVKTILGMILIYALTAGLFEETARLVGAKSLKDNIDFKNMLSFGLGHGICESVLLLGFSNVSNIFTAIGINNGTVQNNLAALENVPENYLENIIAALLTITALTTVCAIVERISAIMFHVFATSLVFKGVREKKIYFYFIAILAHTVFNAVAVLASKYLGIVPTEIILFVLGASGAVFVFLQRPKTDMPKREMI